MQYVSTPFFNLTQASTWLVRGAAQLVFLGLLLCFGCSSPQSVVDGEPVTMPVPNKPVLRFLALGDSYTFGERVSEPERWPVQLANQLRHDNLNVANPDIIARTGWTTDELQRAIVTCNLHGPYDLVSLQIGVNNQYRGRSLETYRMEFRQLLQTAIALANRQPQHVLVLSIPDWGQSPSATGQNRAVISQAIDQFNAVAASECQQAEVAFVDITPLTRQAANDDTQFVSDGLHYSGKHMKQWAKTAQPIARALLTN